MRLELPHTAGSASHQELASGVCWGADGEFYTSSDDGSVQRWSARGESVGKVCALDTAFTDLHCLLGSRKAQQQPQRQHSAAAVGGDVLALGCADGTLKLIASNGRVEKSAEAHAGAVLCVRWSPDGSALATGGEDGAVKVWSRAGMLRATVMAAGDEPVHCLAWGGEGYSNTSQLLACSGATVSIRGIAVGGGVVAVAGATTSAAAGSDGGMRGAVSAAAGRSAAATSRQLSWRAHDALVLAVDWSLASNLIVTGGEDCRFKVWDAFGRLLYQSSAWQHPITSLAWHPDGRLFAAGAFNSLALCDRLGWSHCQVQPSCGSLLGLSWAPDGTKLAGAGGSGAVVLAALLEVVAEDGRVRAVLFEERVVSVVDLVAETRERLEFKDPVLRMSVGWGHLVVCTAAHAHIYAGRNWNTPLIVDLKDRPQALLQSARNFVVMAAAAGLQVLTYEGRQLCSIKPPGLLWPEGGASRQLVSLSSDTLALGLPGGTVRCFETAQGRPVGEPLCHSEEVTAVSLSQAGMAADRLLALLDSNGDLWLMRPLLTDARAVVAVAPAVLQHDASPAGGGAPTVAGLITAGGLVAPGSSQQQQQRQRRQLVKLATNVGAPPVWHDSAPMLAAVVDGQVVVWSHPAAAFLDADLLAATRSTVNAGSEPLGRSASLALFSGSSLLLVQPDGARVFAATAPQPAMVHGLVRQGKWDKAVRLARFSRDSVVWACLAALAMAAGELQAAEAAFAALDAVDKLQLVLRLQRLLAGAHGDNNQGPAGAAAAAAVGTDPLVAAELLLYAGRADEAEAKLLQAGMLYRAIKLRARLHHWGRALELARTHGRHVDTVLLLRARHLAAAGQPHETLAEFRAAAKEVPAVDEGAVRESVRQDKAAEAQQRAAARACGGGARGT